MESNLFVSKYVVDQRKSIASLDTFIAVAEMAVGEAQPKSRKRQFSCVQQSTRSFRPFKQTAAQLYNPLRGPKIISSKKNTDLSSSHSTKAWHAKRMVTHTITEHSVPLQSMQRGLKASKRLYKEKCLIHDVSYSLVACIHVPLEDCFRLFASIADPGDALFQMNLMKIPDMEISLFLHEPQQFPLGLIGPCTVSIHRYQSENNVYMMQLVFWAHPSIHASVLSTLQSSAETECISLDMDNSEAWAWSRIDILGNEANSLLKKMVEGSQGNEFLEQCLNDKIKLHNTWRHGYMLTTQLNDPRCLSHDAKNNAQNSSRDDSSSTKTNSWPSNNDNTTLLWSLPHLQQINSSFESDLVVNRQRQQVNDGLWNDVVSSLKGGKQSVDSSHLQKQTTIFPIIITQHHKSHQPSSDIRTSSLGGWSIIIPRAFVHAVWQHLIHLGGIACGSAEVDFIRRGEGLLSYPRDYLDSEAGWQDYVGRLRSIQEKELKKPPAKRLQWDYDLALMLFQPHDTDSNTDCTSRPDIAVIHNPTCLQPFLPPKLAQFGGEEWLQSMTAHSDWQALDFDSPSDEAIEAIAELPSMPVKTFLHVLIEPVGRGQPHSFAAIYRPTAEDIKGFTRHKMQNKMKLKGMIAKTKDEEVRSEWHGVEMTSESSKQEVLEARRELLGTITSGDDENGSNDLRAVGVCVAERLYEMTRCRFMRLGHPCSHQLVLFRNQGSDWLRPALFRII